MEDLSIVITQLNNNINFCQTFIDTILVNYKTNLFINIPNYQNFHHYSYILVSISNSIETHKELFEMNFAIMYIAEKTYYINKDNHYNKIYVCRYLSQNKLFSSKQMWINLINIKLNTLIEQKAELFKNNNLTKNQKDENQNIVTNFGSKVKNLFKNKHEINNSNNNQLTLNSAQTARNLVDKILKNNYQLPEEVMNEIRQNEASNIIKEYCQHFANFSFDISESTEIILELCENLNLGNERTKFFITYLNSNSHTIKNKGFSTKIDHTKSYLNKEYKDYIGLNDTIITTIASTLKFLDLKDFGNILILSKNTNKKLKKIIYENILLKYHNMDMNLRKSIWNSLLNIVNIYY